jgi:SAM-dependent methyltransferase
MLETNQMKSHDSEPLYRDGRHYDLSNEGYQEDIPFYLRQAQKYGAPLLELACGTGRITIPIARAGFEISGLDISRGMLSYAREKTKHLNLPVEWIQGDIRRFSLRKKFNLIIFPFNSIAHLHDLQSIDACFLGVKKHLAPEGRFILDIFNPAFRYFIRSSPEPRLIAEYPDPDSDNTVVITETNHYEKATQINHIEWHYQAGEKKFTYELNMRIFFPRELDALLIHNGFKIDIKYGDFNESPFTSDSPKQIPVCRVR